MGGKLLCANISGESIFPGACFRVSSAGGTVARGESIYLAVKPDGKEGFYYINGPAEALETRRFRASTERINRALVDWDDANVEFGASVGPVSGAWHLDTTGSGYFVFGQEGPDGLTPVVRNQSLGKILVELLGDLEDPATGLEADPPTAIAGILERQEDGSLAIGAGRIEVINRGRGMYWESGTRGYPDSVLGETYFFPIECDPGGSSSSSLIPSIAEESDNFE